MEDNKYGLLNAENNDHPNVKNISQGNLYLNNEVGIRNDNSLPLRSINDTFSGNDLVSNGNSQVESY